MMMMTLIVYICGSYSVAVSLNIAGLRNVLQLCKRMSKLEVGSLSHLLIIDRVAGEIIRLVASVCVCVCPFVCGRSPV